MKTYSLTVENHLVLGGTPDPDAQAPCVAPRLCAACLSAVDHSRMQYMADVRNHICHDCRESYQEVREYILPMKWWED